MTARTWLGGGNNLASNPLDWSPNGAPHAGDTLTVQGTSAYTVNIQGNALAGDTLTVTDQNTTINLSNNAVAAIRTFYDPVINIAGTVHMSLDDENSQDTVNLAANAHWVGGFNVIYQTGITVNGGPGASFINNMNSQFGSSACGTFTVPVAGTGSMSATHFSTLEFKASVGSGQTIAVQSSTVKVDDPHAYAALTHLQGEGSIDLVGLTGNTSYALVGKYLELFHGNTVTWAAPFKIDPAASYGQGLEVVQAAGGVSIYQSGDPHAGLPLYHYV